MKKNASERGETREKSLQAPGRGKHSPPRHGPFFFSPPSGAPVAPFARVQRPPGFAAGFSLPFCPGAESLSPVGASRRGIFPARLPPTRPRRPVPALPGAGARRCPVPAGAHLPGGSTARRVLPPRGHRGLCTARPAPHRHRLPVGAGAVLRERSRRVRDGEEGEGGKEKQREMGGEGERERGRKGEREREWRRNNGQMWDSGRGERER